MLFKILITNIFLVSITIFSMKQQNIPPIAALQETLKQLQEKRKLAKYKTKLLKKNYEQLLSQISAEEAHKFLDEKKQN